MGPILICTPTVDEDPCVTGVVRALRAMGREAWVLATTRFPGEVPFSLHEEHPFALSFSNGRGVQLFELDPVEYGPDAYTPHQFLYLSHDDLRLMAGYILTAPKVQGVQWGGGKIYF